MPSPTGRKPTRQRLALTLSTWRATLASLRMDFFQQQLNKNREAFISVTEAIVGLRKSSPKSSAATIAQALLQLKCLDKYRLSTVLTKDISNDVYEYLPVPCEMMLRDIAESGLIVEIFHCFNDGYHDNIFPDGELDPDYIGWHRKGFIERLLANDWPVHDSMRKFNGIQKNNLPEWYENLDWAESLGIDEEEPDQPLSTESAKLQEQVKRLQEQVKQFESQAKELETLKQENAELKAKIEALSDGQNPDVDIASGLVFHHETQYLKLVSAVQERYYHPDRFDLTDKSTLPKKEDVKEWLIKNYRLTGAFADAVERVACPVDRAK